MSKRAKHAPRHDPRILADEVGVATLTWNRLRLKSAFQTAYRLDGERLTPFAVEGRALPCLEGVAVEPTMFSIAVPPEERPLLDRLERALHVENLAHAGATGLGLFIALDMRRLGDAEALAVEARDLTDRVDDAGLDPDRIVWMIQGQAEGDADRLAAVAATIRASGMKVGYYEAGPVFSAPDLIAAARPDMVRVSYGGLARLRAPELDALLRLLFSTLRQRGASVLVTGIADAAELDGALATGADAYQGLALAAPGLAGTLFDLAPIEVRRALGQGATVTPLFG